MRILFIHNQLPGQFLHLIRYLTSHSHQVYGICHQHYQAENEGLGFQQLFCYQPKSLETQSTHHYVTDLQRSVLNAQAVHRVLQRCKQQGLAFDVAISHTGWGDALYFKAVYPQTPLIGYVEFFFHASGADAGFDPLYPVSADRALQIKTLNSQLLLGMNECDALVTPTRWQQSLFPEHYQSLINVIHEGVDIDICRPKDQVCFTLPNGCQLTRDDEVVTYSARNLEPYRGFPVFMKAVELICQRRPNCHIVITGGDEISYSRRLPEGQCYRELALEKVNIPTDRVHFLGRVSYQTHVQLLQLSSCHVYLTYPFVLSWSFIEAMACGCVMIASNTQPVLDVLQPGINGLCVDFFDHQQIANQVDLVLNDPQRKKSLASAARKTIENHYQHHFAINHYLRLFEQLTTAEACLPE